MRWQAPPVSALILAVIVREQNRLTDVLSKRCGTAYHGATQYSIETARAVVNPTGGTERLNFELSTLPGHFMDLV